MPTPDAYDLNAGATPTSYFSLSAGEAYDLNAPKNSGPDSIPPVVSDISPPDLSTLTRNQTVSFSVTDNVATKVICLKAEYLDGDGNNLGVSDFVHDNDTFGQPFSNDSCVRNPIAGGYRFTLRRNGGWPGQPVLKIIAVDTSGNEN